ncbi:hypothetical protein [Flavobacterium subsaxonicum]|uniref:hypothetical protein n=1 Tax=Flavobacterium subsaxonicum TaxID=426226 RepID=UPI001377E2AE|nr:hypothetical protein [Flavobacterium subsaxonicum]
MTINTYCNKDSEITFTNPENYDKTKVFKQDVKATFTESLEDINIIRNASRGFKSTLEFDRNAYELMKKRAEREFNQRLLWAYKGKRIFVRADQFGDKQVPNWIDSIIYRLFEVHKITPREIERLMKHIEKRGFMDFPQLDIKKSLIGLNAIQQKKEQESDHIDFIRLAVGLPPSDILFTDKRRKAEIVELGLDKKYKCHVFSGTPEDLKSFKELIRSL